MKITGQLRVLRSEKGFTLVELMVTLTIAAILLMVAVPSFTQMIASSAVSSNVNSFLADMRYARSEAIRRGSEVALCRVTDPDATNPTCLSAQGTDGWVTGWIVFEDLDSV
jgi:type IV fimbrial biogenesis protein FimT